MFTRPGTVSGVVSHACPALPAAGRLLHLGLCCHYLLADVSSVRTLCCPQTPWATRPSGAVSWLGPPPVPGCWRPGLWVRVVAGPSPSETRVCCHGLSYLQPALPARGVRASGSGPCGRCRGMGSGERPHSPRPGASPASTVTAPHRCREASPTCVVGAGRRAQIHGTFSPTQASLSSCVCFIRRKFSCFLWVLSVCFHLYMANPP